MHLGDDLIEEKSDGINENKNESEIDTVGESDTLVINSVSNEERTPAEGAKLWKESEQEHQINQGEVKNLWEDDSLIGCKK